MLLGNGFDLYYKLPTKYADFLYVVSFLQANRDKTFETIGDIFSEDALQKSDPFIKVCYETHKAAYDTTPLNKELTEEIITLTKDNIWFAYLQKVFNKDVGWIDFEKEIGVVLGCFEQAFKKRTVFSFNSNEKHLKCILQHFKFFVDKPSSGVAIGAYAINKDYCKEDPIGSDHIIINTEKVVDKLYEELCNISKALTLYLKCFVESTYGRLKNDGACGRLEFFSHMERAITFNYTNTYESLYFNNSAFHIHGSTNGEIVLGINSDESDTIENINTTFVCFKKYFQRTLFDTDSEYLRWIKGFVDSKLPYRLFTMGHSLDITDKDIIEDLFRNAKEIIVLYHSIDSKISYIKNLIEIFGKTDFEMLKNEKNLIFVSLNQDFSSLKRTLSEESWADLHAMLSGEVGEERVLILFILTLDFCPLL